ncbi:gamma-glutamyltransferase 1 Threonine peptidase. MEROPS family T03 [Arsukibacterium tuosuense]|uniref:Glutathione hydrolase proenzyme n=1 Tax=Arsukibacterium tuosuense TaxID=1323745 RepID=A0A285I8J6_9GAMM|nr:gamma-glutamyltransferase [Arsukibacterium tuosuense]SNY44312.1 gamma-glutamyltransferase 1 Threonine peptidase. MEROPS family T03 [Arsukibacterium tuosuense]
MKLFYLLLINFSLLLSIQTAVASALPQQSVPQQEIREPEATTGLTEQQLVRSKQAMVAAAHPLAVAAGQKILAKGGSAVDAAIATQLMLGLVEPQSSGIGGGAFILHWHKASQRLTSFDGREKAPALADGELFSDKGKQLDWREAYVGGKSVGVPGVLKALAMAHQQYGRLPWPALFDDAITAAEQGFQVTPRMAKHLKMGWNQGVKTLAPAKDYFYPDGQALASGKTITNPQYGKLLRAIAKEGVVAFYQGENAEALVKTVRSAATNPGLLSLEDLRNYQAVEREVLCQPYRQYQVCGMAPPSSGGIAVLQILGILSEFDLAKLQPGSAEAVHLLSQAARLAFADRERFLADADYSPVPVAGLLDPAYLASRAKLIDPQRNLTVAAAGLPDGAESLADAAAIEFENTSHLSVVDQYGNAVSMTTSIENVFGSGLMVNGYLLNNQLTDFSLRAEVNGKLVANRVEGGKRPRSSMAPMMVFDQDNNLKLLTGSPGGSRIINYVAQNLVAVLDWQLNLEQAINLPRFTHRNDYLALEAGTPLAELAPRLEAMGYQVRLQDLNSGIHAIAVKAEGLEGVADPRREGTAAGH